MESRTLAGDELEERFLQLQGETRGEFSAVRHEVHRLAETLRVEIRGRRRGNAPLHARASRGGAVANRRASNGGPNFDAPLLITKTRRSRSEAVWYNGTSS